MTRLSTTRAATQATTLQKAPRDARVASEWRGRMAEILAMVLLVLRGYRILARRWRTSAGELDLVAVRGKRLAFVEVKYRRSTDATADAVGVQQCRRLYAAADIFVGRYRRYESYDRAFDAVFVVPGAWPVYAPDHLRPGVSRP